MENQEFLEKIVGYLPYGLKIKTKDMQTSIGVLKGDVLKVTGIRTFSGVIVFEFKEQHECVSIKDSMLILKPLSDLTKEIEHNGEKFVPIIELGIRESKESLKTLPVKLHLKEIPDIAFSIRGFYSREYLKPSKIQKLYEWHFDIHGLIEKGLAIDINTL